MASFTASLPKDKLATCSKAKFLQSLNGGTVKKEEFNEWLSHDYVFLGNYKSFLSKVLTQAPKDDHEFLEENISGIPEELTWLENKLKESNVNVHNIKPTADDIADQEWLDELIQTKKSYLSLITAIYGLELSNHEAWKLVKAADYQEFAKRTTSADAKENVDGFQEAVDAAAETASENDKKEARKVWDEVMTS
jgi:thiaminase